MKDEKKVFLYFLGFKADDLKVYYDDQGIAAVAYLGTHELLKDSDVIRFCFEEGYIDRRGDVAFALYGYTDNPDIARSFEMSRNMHIFKKVIVKYTAAEYSKLKRFTETMLTLEHLQCGKDESVPIAMNQYEVIKIYNMDASDLVADWDDVSHVFEFLPMYNGMAYYDEILSDSMNAALSAIRFRYFLGEEGNAPIDPDVQINEWALFCLYFQDTFQ